MSIKLLRPLGLTLTLMAGLSPPAPATPYYVQAVEQARPDDDRLRKAGEKVERHRALSLHDDLDDHLPPFHKRLDSKVTKGETFCQICHLPLPHGKKLRTRAFLNMHSRFIACGTCHLRPRESRFVYQWLDYHNGNVVPASSEQFRTGRPIDNSIPLNGWVKISPFSGGEPAIPLPGEPFAVKVAEQWEHGDLSLRSRLQAKLHLPLKEKGPDCQACHGDDQPLLDLESLGAPPVQAQNIRHHVVPQFFGRYQSENEQLKIIDILQ